MNAEQQLMTQQEEEAWKEKEVELDNASQQFESLSDKRKREIEKMMSYCNHEKLFSIPLVYNVCRKLYDAGYRKVGK